MTGVWLASYLALWVLVAIVCLLMVGMMRQLGLIYRELRGRPAETSPEGAIPAREDDGPTIGSPIVDLEDLPIVNSVTTELFVVGERGSTLIVFMSPMCEICHRIVEPLNALSTNHEGAVRTTVVLRGDLESCRAFLRVFPLRVPVICDADSSLTMSLNIHRIPFGLMYERGVLLRKGALEGYEDISAVLGKVSTMPASRTS